MAERIRRNRRAPSVDNTAEIERLMQSIAASQQAIEQHKANIAMCSVELYDEMVTGKVEAHTVNNIVAERYRPAGRTTNTIDPQGFRQACDNDKDFYSAISVSNTKAQQVVPAKKLATITTSTPGKVGEETVRVRRVGG